jgi:uncharacterized membrane protein
MATALPTPIGMRERRALARLNGSARVNVGRSERLASLLGGGMVTMYGLSRGTTKGLILAGIGAAMAYRGATGNCQVYQVLGLDSTTLDKPKRGKPIRAIPSGQGVKIEESVTINQPPEVLYGFWRSLSNLPQVMRQLVSVHELDSQKSHWIARGPMGNVEWDAEIVTDRHNEVISWRSLPGSTVATAGSVSFERAPGDRGTQVHVVLSYNPPAGQLGAAMAWLAASDPQTEIRAELQNFKRIMETGRLPTTQGQPRGHCC